MKRTLFPLSYAGDGMPWVASGTVGSPAWLARSAEKSPRRGLMAWRFPRVSSLAPYPLGHSCTAGRPERCCREVAELHSQSAPSVMVNIRRGADFAHPPGRYVHPCFLHKSYFEGAEGAGAAGDNFFIIQNFCTNQNFLKISQRLWGEFPRSPARGAISPQRDVPRSGTFDSPSVSHFTCIHISDAPASAYRGTYRDNGDLGDTASHACLR